ncbi:hypothetical protein DFH29DRAFT_967873 [Suillus ampliporus]|nr:hypothetical protein DFH29DRAFT_967873 [Suillus ampliporus]
MIFRAHFGWHRSMFINALLILWAFRLTLDPTKPLNDMGFMTGERSNWSPCTIDIGTRIPETEVRRMMQHYPEVASLDGINDDRH